MLLSAKEIIDNGEKWNKEWLLTNGSEHYLYAACEILHNKSDIFAVTSCEVTSAVIRWKSDCLYKELTFIGKNASYESIYKNYSYFQITIGDDWSDCNHILTIWHDVIIQSYYNKYKIKSFIITPVIIDALNNISKPGNYEKVTSIKNDNTKNLKVFYWI
jgi:hypothetical protein